MQGVSKEESNADKMSWTWMDTDGIIYTIYIIES